MRLIPSWMFNLDNKVPKTVSSEKPRSLRAIHSISSPRLGVVSPPHRRLPKFTRAKPSWRPPLALQDRDLEFLRAAVDYRLLSTPQYLLLFPESRDAVYRRLQRLFHHGYLDRLRGDPTAPMVYALASRGADVLVERGYLKETSGWSKKNREIMNRYVAHQAMVANFRITLELAVKERQDVRILFFRREGLDLRDRVAVRNNGREETFPINPDGFFGLQFPDLPDGRNRAFFFLECDRSTMTRERFARKLDAYRQWYESGRHTAKHGIRSFRVLTLTKSEERARSLLGVSPREPFFWFTSEKRFAPDRPSSIFEPIWETPGQQTRPRSLLPEQVPPSNETTVSRDAGGAEG